MPQSIPFPPPTPPSHPAKPTPATSTSFDLRLVSDPIERRELFALRLRAYQQFMDVAARSEQTSEYRDSFDDAPTTVLMGAYDRSSGQERLVGAMRLCFCRPWDSLDTLPCAAYYPALQPVKRAARGSLMEVSRFSIEPEISNTSYRTTLYASLVRASLVAAEAAGVSTILIATRPDWVRFYKYMLGFEEIGVPAMYPPGDIKIALLGGSLDQARKRQRMQNAFFKITPEEISGMRTQLSPLLTRIEAA